MAAFALPALTEITSSQSRISRVAAPSLSVEGSPLSWGTGNLAAKAAAPAPASEGPMVPGSPLTWGIGATEKANAYALGLM